MHTVTHNLPPRIARRIPTPVVIDLLLVGILIIAAFFRLEGLFWGEYQYLHPDERFLIWVGTDISPVESLSDYFDTANSSLNPHNRGHGFYVYGTFPMFAARYLAEWVFGQSGFNEMTQVGRSLSAAVDLLAVFLVFLIAKELYNKKVGLLAAAFSAGVVLQIQQSHFFTMDTFANTFALLAFYFAVRVMVTGQISPAPPPADEATEALSTAKRLQQSLFIRLIRAPLFLPSLGFGAALGMAVASKLNAAPVAMVLPAAFLIGLTRQPLNDRQRYAFQAMGYLALAAFTSLLVFRVLQPYAFSGPGFFDVGLNPQWVANIREQRAQSNGNVDFPPAMQWARRSVWFSGKNMLLWGLGLPLGILAWAGYLVAGWRMLVGGKRFPDEWRQHLLIWLWTGIYFTWQSLALNPTMRYQLPVYPTLTIFAAWAVVSLHDYGKKGQFLVRLGRLRTLPWRKLVAGLIGAVVLISTYAYAYGFTKIYTRPITRVEASRWIYQNIPGPITLSIQTPQGQVNQPLPFPYSVTISPGIPYSNNFVPKASGELTQIILPRLSDQQATHAELTLQISIFSVPGEDEPLVSLSATQDFTPPNGQNGVELVLNLEQPLPLDPTQTYRYLLEIAGEQPSATVSGSAQLHIQPSLNSPSTDPVEVPLETQTNSIQPATTLPFEFVSPIDGFLTHLEVENITNQDGVSYPRLLTLSLTMPDDPIQSPVAGLSVTPKPNGTGFLLALKPSLAVYTGQSYVLNLGMIPEGGSIQVHGAGIASEGDWDDNLPLRLDGYDGYGGIYPQDLTFNMYWDENQEKRERFIRILDETDYIVISSSRQWGSLPRLPERFPMTSVYYRALIGCPESQLVEHCYNIAEPGMYQGDLGFELIQVFQSDPGFGPFSINDQASEEAFTVYDHPKVFVFKKTPRYDAEKTASLLQSVDLSQVVRIAPMLAGPHPANLLLPDYLLNQQRTGGTWSELFNTYSLTNRYPILGAILWYVILTLLGWLTYPILRSALPGLADKGFPLARTAGMLILAYLAWLGGSSGLAYSRPTISLALGCMLVMAIFTSYQQRAGLLEEFRTKRKYFLTVELLMLAFFTAFLLVRLGNPDLWHPWKGGEKPMDFSYFNAVIKSSVFPPYDPWYAGGYLNYYYFGFVIAGTLVKWLGIVPSIAYNLLLPTFFSLIAMGAFSIAWNLYTANRDENDHSPARTLSAYVPALAGAIGMAVLGNLGTVRMIFQGYQRLSAPGGTIEGASLITRWIWAVQGLIQVIKGVNLPYSIGDWYWIPSRAIPAPGDIEPITEFPFFTVLYGDLHAHLMALPVTLLALSCFIGLILGKARWKRPTSVITWFLLSGLAVGALRPTNTWDFPPYLALGILAVGYTIWKYWERNGPELPLQTGTPNAKNTSAQSLDRGLFQGIRGLFADIPSSTWRITGAMAGAVLLVGAAFLLFQPFTNWYALGYTKVDLWEGTRTPVTAYLTHWGLFLFVIVTWMGWESLRWLAETPLSALRRLQPYKAAIQTILALILVIILGLLWMKIRIAWLVLPLATWAGVLLLRPRQSDARRIVLFLVGTGLVLTLMVEIIVLRGDIGRMNTVFKFYLQVWTLFAISAAAALAWILQAMHTWYGGWQKAWLGILIVLVAGAGLYPLLAGAAKIKDRMAPQAPHTLNGMDFMMEASYTDEWGSMDLSQDYRAIRWMQENVIGSPVIVEANLRNLYRWGSRFSIYTGLPGVVGWEWHQQQQRAVVPGTWITNRILEIDSFYLTTDWEAATQFLQKYHVQYIIVGQQERGHYPGLGLQKFSDANGFLWVEVYQDQDTVIYQVIGD